MASGEVEGATRPIFHVGFVRRGHALPMQVYTTHGRADKALNTLDRPRGGVHSCEKMAGERPSCPAWPERRLTGLYTTMPGVAIGVSITL